MRPIHYFEDSLFNDKTFCGAESGSWSFKEDDVTCPHCLASMWVNGMGGEVWERYEQCSKVHGRYIPYGETESGTGNWEFMAAHDFLSLPENYDLFAVFVLDHN